MACWCEDLYPALLDVVSGLYSTPTAIQDSAIRPACYPYLKDIVGIAETGSGKTLAFLLPIINNILYYRDQLYDKGSGKGRMQGFLLKSFRLW
jgi:ATP-dependent RNA helicase DDX56/DBP9